MIYTTYPAWVLGFHGCDESVCNDVIHNRSALRPSINDYDWLGHGIYFWENNPLRAYEFALEQQKRGKVKKPAVVGAIIDLNNCLDMTDLFSLQFVSQVFEFFQKICEINGTVLPVNSGPGSDRPLRKLDCAVIESLHLFVDQNDGYSPYDSVRGAFIEGPELFCGSGFRKKDHMQLCIRNTNCIKGYFSPLLNLDEEYRKILL